MSYLHELFSLEGKTALVTGASRGLGRAAAIALSSAGADLILVGRDVEALQETQSLLAGESTIAEADVTSASDREQVIAQAPAIDILVNNAGIIKRHPVLEYPIEDWDAVIETNLTSVFEWSKAAAIRMKSAGWGRIINIASLLSFSGGSFVPAYAAAKGGVAQLTKAMSNELAAHNITVNAIAPGYFETDATSALRSNPDRMKQLLSRIPKGRFGEPDELAGAFVYLASEASAYMTGHILTVDGGFNSF